MHKGRNEEKKLNGDAQQERKYISDVIKILSRKFDVSLNKEWNYDAE